MKLREAVKRYMKRYNSIETEIEKRKFSIKTLGVDIAMKLKDLKNRR